MIEIREVLRLWLAGDSLREETRLDGLDRKTVRRYVQAAEAAGVSRGGGDGQLTEELLGAVVAVVRLDRPRAMVRRGRQSPSSASRSRPGRSRT